MNINTLHGSERNIYYIPKACSQIYIFISNKMTIKHRSCHYVNMDYTYIAHKFHGV